MLGKSPQLIYVKTPKTAGTSILSALRERFGSCVHIAGRHRGWPSEDEIRASPLIVLGEVVARRFRRCYKGIWRDARSFAVVRNPYDKAISAWQYLPSLRGLSLEDALTIAMPRKPFFRRYEDEYIRFNHDYVHFSQPQSDWLCDHRGRLIVTDILRYEQLDAYWAGFVDRNRLGIGGLPFLNRTEGKSGVSISARAIRIIADKFKRDFDCFAYPLALPSDLSVHLCSPS